MENSILYTLIDHHDDQVHSQIKNIFYGESLSRFKIELREKDYYGIKIINVIEIKNGFAKICLGYISLDILSKMYNVDITFKDLLDCEIVDIFKTSEEKYKITVRIVFSDNIRVNDIYKSHDVLLEELANEYARKKVEYPIQHYNELYNNHYHLRAYFAGTTYNGEDRVKDIIDVFTQNKTLDIFDFGRIELENNSRDRFSLTAFHGSKKIGYLNFNVPIYKGDYLFSDNKYDNVDSMVSFYIKEHAYSYGIKFKFEYCKTPININRCVLCADVWLPINEHTHRIYQSYMELENYQNKLSSIASYELDILSECEILDNEY